VCQDKKVFLAEVRLHRRNGEECGIQRRENIQETEARDQITKADGLGLCSSSE
jgi:hypothetical protein